MPMIKMLKRKVTKAAVSVAKPCNKWAELKKIIYANSLRL